METPKAKFHTDEELLAKARQGCGPAGGPKFEALASQYKLFVYLANLSWAGQNDAMVEYYTEKIRKFRLILANLAGE